MDRHNLILLIILWLLLTVSLIVAITDAAPRIAQGEIVYLNDTVDISGVTGWASSIAWYGGDAPYEGATPVTIELPDTKNGYYNFYINPELFRDRLGYWYQFYDTYEPAGNLLAFEVRRERSFTVNQTNQTGRLSWNVTNQTVPFEEQIQPAMLKHILEPVEIADYVIAQGDPLHINVSTTASGWLFGTTDGIYDKRAVNGWVSFTVDEIRNLPPGSYDLLIHVPRNGTEVLTVRYNAAKRAIEYFNPEDFHVYSKEIDYMSPKVAEDFVIQYLGKSADKYAITKLEYQEPFIDIRTIDSILLTNYSTLLDIRGYTNVARDTKVWATFDEDDLTQKGMITVPGTAEGERIGYLRYYKILMPLTLTEIRPGAHYITVRTSKGGWQTVQYFKYNSPEHSYIPNKTVMYMGGNEWKPDPTPIIQTVTVRETVKVIEKVTVPVTPTDEQVRKAQGAALTDIIIWGIIAIVLLGGTLFVGVYLFTVIRRARLE